MTVYYPLMFEPVYKQLIWGGSRLAELFGRELPFDRVGESWDISCRPGDEMGIVRNGRLRGTSFIQLTGINPEGYLGGAFCALASGECSAPDRFPLLVKLIDANADLSIQVHPKEKNEAWYIIYAPEGARICAGLAAATDKETFAAALADGEVEKYLAFVPVKAGDVINIPAGTVHALTAGLVIAEIQQNADTTYRIYDYNRVDAVGKRRPLHIPEALAAIDFGAGECRPIQGQARDVDGGCVIFYCATEHYALLEYRVDTCIRERSEPERFFIFTCVEGRCEIRANGYCATVRAGDSVFIPAALGEYEIAGKARLIKSFVPGSVG